MRDKTHNAARVYRVGLDEVGRGPLAGPVTVGCVFLPVRYTPSLFRKLEKVGTAPPLRDSKQLTEKQREAWYTWVKSQKDIMWAVASNTAQVIDRKGIVLAANKAADKAFVNATKGYVKNIEHKKVWPPYSVASVRLDYGLRASVAGNQTMHKKGDEKYPEIALASIMAKVTRDRYMQKVDKEVPMYCFAQNKGYGSLVHRTAIISHGLSKYHRASFVHGDNTLGKNKVQE